MDTGSPATPVKASLAMLWFHKAIEIPVYPEIQNAVPRFSLDGRETEINNHDK
jgi:hypothetical protein